MSGDLPFLDEAPATTTEGVSPEAPATDEGPARGPDGKFIAKDQGGDVGNTDVTSEPAPAPSPAAAPPAAEPEKTRDIPITALLDEREKRQRAENERDQLNRRFQDLERRLAAAQQPPAKIPDLIEDQEGFVQYIQQQQRQSQEQQMRLVDHLEAQFSERMARKEYGTEAVDAALAAAQERGVIQHFLSGPDRWERMCEWHKQQAVVAEIGNDPAAYRAKLEAEVRASIEAEYAAKYAQRARPTPPPPSMAGAPAASGATAPVARGAVLNSIIP